MVASTYLFAEPDFGLVAPIQLIPPDRAGSQLPRDLLASPDPLALPRPKRDPLGEQCHRSESHPRLRRVPGGPSLQHDRCQRTERPARRCKSRLSSAVFPPRSLEHPSRAARIRAASISSTARSAATARLSRTTSATTTRRAGRGSTSTAPPRASRPTGMCCGISPATPSTTTT